MGLLNQTQGLSPLQRTEKDILSNSDVIVMLFYFNRMLLLNLLFSKILFHLNRIKSLGWYCCHHMRVVTSVSVVKLQGFELTCFISTLYVFLMTNLSSNYRPRKILMWWYFHTSCLERKCLNMNSI